MSNKLKEVSLLRSELQLQGVLRMFKRHSDNDPFIYTAQFHNIITRNAKDQILNSLAQAVGTKLSATMYMRKMGFFSGTAPDDPVIDAMDDNGASALEWLTLTVAPPALSTTSSMAEIEFEATHTATGAETINFIVLGYDASVAASNAFAVIEVAPCVLAAGEMIKCCYTLTYNYYTGYSEV